MRDSNTDAPPKNPSPNSRRRFLALSATAGAALGACAPGDDQGAPAVPSRLGDPVRAYGARSPFEKSRRRMRATKTPEATASYSPLAEQQGIITPSALHFERHHAGVPDIDPGEHKLYIHGLVERPLVFTLEELQRLPAESHIYFVECSGNGRGEWKDSGAADAQTGFGLASCSEWTGVSLGLLLAEAGIQAEAEWLIADGADACKMARSLPVDKALDDVLVAYAQNGEALRPEQGYPLRLIVPGWEGNINVKWLRQIKAVTQPGHFRDETSKYTDLLPDGTARQFSYVMEARALITFPSGRQTLDGPGAYEIRGLAWSGRGAIDSVEVTTDGGATWSPATLSEPRLDKAFTRFTIPWTWDGSPADLRARAIDSSGYIQPSIEELGAARGFKSDYHCNGIKSWKINASGEVSNA